MKIIFWEVENGIAMSAPNFRYIMQVLANLEKVASNHGIDSITTCRSCLHEFDSNSNTCGEDLQESLDQLKKELEL